MNPSTAPSPGRHAVRRRLAPLYASVFLNGVALWAPIEKLFMVGIGFDAAAIGLMAAAYAAVVPLCEVPSGILADRWSRRGVMLLGVASAAISVLIGGLSTNVASYVVSTLFLGLYFALMSGTVDAVAYDILLEETGDGANFERVIGRLRLTESVALVASAFAGSLIAELLSLRASYLLTLIPLAGAAVALALLHEPQLHRRAEPVPIRRQLRDAYGALLRPGSVRRVVAILMLTSVLVQSVLEVGPWWLVVLDAPAFGYGWHWAGVTAALGIGGLLGGSLWLATTRGSMMAPLLGVLAAGALVVAAWVPLVILAQVLLTLLMVAISIPATRRLHDALDSTVRASVASGVGGFSWLAFMPFAVLLGQAGQHAGTWATGLLLVAVTLAVALVSLSLGTRRTHR